MRPITSTDLAAVHALERRIEVHEGRPLATPYAEFEEWLWDPFLDLARDTRLVELDGAVVAWARVWCRDEREREARAYLFGGVDPAHRQQGIGSELLAWSIAAARARLEAAPAGIPRVLRGIAYAGRADALALFARHGLEPARFTDELLRALAEPTDAVTTPGIAIVAWDDARSEDARVAENEAFSDHWGSAPRDPVAWRQDLTSHGARPDLSFLALDGDRVVGLCRNRFFPDDEAVTGRREAWIQNLSVVRSHRKRGIASALVVASIEAFRHAGFTHAALGVDSENPTGAYGLYERLGFRRMHRIVVCQRTLS
jgi:ribosomal protein S18 acetylase RimI-like enzyme